MNYEIITPCRLAHLREILPRLRAEERAECAALGCKPRHVAYELRRSSAYSAAAICSDGVIACWGDAASMLVSCGELWLLTSNLVERWPLAFYREVGKVLTHVLTYRSTVRTSILASSERSLRFYQMLGFTVFHDRGDGFIDLLLGQE